MESQSLERILGEHPFFKDLLPAHLATLVGCASNVKFDAGAFLAREGESADRFFLLRFGRVALEVFAPSQGPIAIEAVDAGEVLGWSWLFPPYKWHFDARALTLVRALAIDGTCLRRKCEDDAVLGRELFRRFAHVAVHRLEATQLQLLDLYAARP